MVRPILKVPAALLHMKSEAVANAASQEIKALIQDLKDSCIAAEGVGLAASQIGVSKRVIVIHDGTGVPYALINPEIVWGSVGTTVLEEGCLSIPGVVVAVPRPKSVKVRAIAEDGNTVELKGSDLLAKILQHEIDHLNGVLITDYQNPTMSS